MSLVLRNARAINAVVKWFTGYMQQGDVGGGVWSSFWVFDAVEAFPLGGDAAMRMRD